MRRVLLLVLAAGVVLAGCGSSSAGSAPDPLTTALSYFPTQSPFVMTVATKPSAQATAQQRRLLQRFPLAGVSEAAAMSRLQQLGINFNGDIKPLFGNPVVLGDADSSLQGFANGFLVAWVTNDPSKLDALVKKLHGLQSTGIHDGAKLYSASGAALAITGPTLLFARNAAELTSALDRHAQGGGVSSSQYATAISGLSSGASVHMFGDLAGVLSMPQAASARRVPWVAALRSYGATFGSTTSGVTIQFRLDTGGVSLSPSQLPFAAGASPANLVAGLPIEVGIRDPAQIADFVESAEQAASPQSYTKFLKQQATVRRKTGVDINGLISQFRGDLIIDSDTHTTLARAGIANPATVEAMLTKLGATNNGLGSNTRLRPLGAGVFATSHGARQTLIAVIRDQLVIGEPPTGGHLSAASLRSFASAPSAPVPGASGAFSFRISLSQLITLMAKPTMSPIARQLLGLLGDFSGSMAATPAAVTGSATIGLK
jgi:hypothetical protein